MSAGPATSASTYEEVFTQSGLARPHAAQLAHVLADLAPSELADAGQEWEALEVLVKMHRSDGAA